MKSDQARDWQYSNDHCRHHGGHLASIHSQAENDYIKGDYWIGLIKMQPGGQRKWSDNTIYDYTNWGDGGTNYTNVISFSEFSSLTCLVDNFWVHLKSFTFFQSLMISKDMKIVHL